MRILFFDMEFANGKVGGSIYSIGYLITDEDFEVLVPPTDVLINPECEWNEYVKENILAYPLEQVEAAPPFSGVYADVCSLFAQADLAVGFSVSNDNRALKKDCVRYGLEMPLYRYFDVEKLCRQMEEHKEAHGLKGYATAWCGKEPDNAHRSDGDALATMELFRAICKQKHVTPEMILEAFPDCVGRIGANQPKSEKKRTHRRGNKESRGGRSRRGHAKQKALNRAAETNTAEQAKGEE